MRTRQGRVYETEPVRAVDPQVLDAVVGPKEQGCSRRDRHGVDRRAVVDDLTPIPRSVLQGDRVRAGVVNLDRDGSQQGCIGLLVAVMLAPLRLLSGLARRGSMEQQRATKQG